MAKLVWGSRDQLLKEFEAETDLNDCRDQLNYIFKRLPNDDDIDEYKSKLVACIHAITLRNYAGFSRRGSQNIDELENQLF